ncbi:DUF202 domain-containing protein [bacterium]|nr:DUF202 domain-containing protein [bacterium]
MIDQTSRNEGDGRPVLSSTEMAVMRTRLALERTLDAWVRTALSMITFGFTIYRFLQQMQERMPAPPDRPHAARHVGLALAAIGTLGLTAALCQHVKAYEQLGLHVLRRPVSVSLVIGCCIALLGLLVFLGIAVRVGPF